MNNRVITFVDTTNDNTYEINLLCAFSFDNSKIIIYTKNEKDYDDSMIIYFGKIEMRDGKQYIINVKDSFECERVKNIIRCMVQYGMEG